MSQVTCIVCGSETVEVSELPVDPTFKTEWAHWYSYDCLKCGHMGAITSNRSLMEVAELLCVNG